MGTNTQPGDYWLTAIGETFLIQKNYAEAARNYDAAIAMARTQVGAHTSTWSQACALMAKLMPSDAERVLVRKAFEHLSDCPHLQTDRSIAGTVVGGSSLRPLAGGQ